MKWRYPPLSAMIGSQRRRVGPRWTGWPSRVESSTPSRLTTATSASSRTITSRVWARIAGMSGAMTLSPAPRPTPAGAVLGRDEAIRRLRRDDADGVGAAELPERALDRILQAGGVFEVALDQMRQHLRVGLGLEGVALGQEPLLDREGIFQNAVVDDHEGAGAG